MTIYRSFRKRSSIWGTFILNHAVDREERVLTGKEGYGQGRTGIDMKGPVWTGKDGYGQGKTILTGRIGKDGYGQGRMGMDRGRTCMDREGREKDGMENKGQVWTGKDEYWQSRTGMYRYGGETTDMDREGLVWTGRNGHVTGIERERWERTGMDRVGWGKRWRTGWTWKDRYW